MLENRYQMELIKRLRFRFPGIVIVKNDPGYIQGFPDLTLLWHGTWAVLEVKGSARAPQQPNQEYYVDMLDEMCFAAFIFPENEDEVLDALQRSFEACGGARVPQR